jgi:hypothetical protein
VRSDGADRCGGAVTAAGGGVGCVDAGAGAGGRRWARWPTVSSRGFVNS